MEHDKENGVLLFSRMETDQLIGVPSRLSEIYAKDVFGLVIKRIHELDLIAESAGSDRGHADKIIRGLYRGYRNQLVETARQLFDVLIRDDTDYTAEAALDDE